MLNILCAKTLIDGSIKATLKLGKGADSGSSDLLQDTNLRQTLLHGFTRASAHATERDQCVAVWAQIGKRARNGI
jgi:hypothetical protein